MELGSGQEHVRARLERAARRSRHPSRTWQNSPPMRNFERSPGVAHRAIRRLVSLGVIAIQSTLGCEGFVRFTFGVRLWRGLVLPRPRVLARIRGIAAVTGQLLLLPSALSPPDPPPIVRLPPPPHAGPTRVGYCGRCGGTERVLPGLTVDPETGRYVDGYRCVDHAACDARRAAR